MGINGGSLTNCATLYSDVNVNDASIALAAAPQRITARLLLLLLLLLLRGGGWIAAAYRCNEQCAMLAPHGAYTRLCQLAAGTSAQAPCGLLVMALVSCRKLAIVWHCWLQCMRRHCSEGKMRDIKTYDVSRWLHSGVLNWTQYIFTVSYTHLTLPTKRIV